LQILVAKLLLRSVIKNDLIRTVKFLSAIFVLCILLSCDSVFNRVQEKVEQKVNEKIDKTIDDAMNKMDTALSKISLDSLKKMTITPDSAADRNAQKLKEKTNAKEKNK
jgi:hypothetical protein